MVKRPLFWLFCPFMLGIASNKYICSKFQIILLILFFFLFSILFYSFLKVKYSKFTSQDKCILWFPVAFGIGCFLTFSQITQEKLKLQPREELLVTVWGEVAKLSEKATYQEVYLKQVQILPEGKEKTMISWLVYKDKDFTPLYNGDLLTIQGKLSLCERARNPGNYDEYLSYQAKNIYYKLQKGIIINRVITKNLIYIGIAKIKKRVTLVYDAVLTESDGAILKAMVLGDKSALDADIKTLYQKAGISHILAISGLHISMIGLLLFSLLKKAGIHHNLASVLCILLIYLYGILTGFSVSTNRAVVMMVLSLTAVLVSRTYDSMSAIALSGFLILCQQPFQLFQCGFQLSFLAVISAVWFYPACHEFLAEWMEPLTKQMEYKEKMEAFSLSVVFWKLGRKIGKALLASSAIQLITLPVLMWFYFEFPVLSPFLNLLVLPFTSLLMILALLIALTGCFFLPLASLFAGGVHYILFFYQVLCCLFHNIPYNMQITGRPKGWQVFFFYILILVFTFSVKIYKKKRLSVLLLAACFCLFWHVPEKGMEVTFLDIGQGDCIYMQTESGLHLMMDGGSTDESAVGIYRIQPFLLSKGIKELDYCFLSHMDTDHISGIQEILKGAKEPGNVRINCIVLPKTSFIDEKLITMSQQAKEVGTKVLYLEKGQNFHAGKLAVTCLHPYPDFYAETENDYSMVLEVLYGKFSMLLTGDVGVDGENSMLEAGVLHRKEYDILKAAHHGSKYTNSAEWLARIRPKLTIISAGYKNRYGHPHRETLERLAAVESQVRKTMDYGAVTILFQNQRASIQQFLK